ncbi:haloacid dehalogenase superfamily, subfamily IA, variant 1 [Longilinea arvoryzae]|uniref:Haloacid dehalogenase superfamily, subfamily IA, variant 1 n=1 Tax=Longilinea arvoryzae TaxID=360412 RepID=A0A0S7B8N3_9CHLR|nr:HAD family hydrolase [Longilinea arvoryzae]GAP13871.1 haloacid dehalogenase superfamily, subfamily IA, variant 1 [Longilinea arvoryzae]
MTSRPHIHNIFFDLGSTLMYYDGAWPEALLESAHQLGDALEQAGYRLDWHPFLEEFHSRMNAYFVKRDKEFLEYTTEFILKTQLADFGHPDVPIDVVRGALAKMYAVTQAHWHIEQDTLPTLEALKKAGFRLGLISNAGDAADANTLIDKAEIRPYFQTILISAEVGYRKPAARIFEMALEEMKAIPEESLMVGDLLQADVVGAHNQGMRAVWIARRVDTPENRALAGQIKPDGIIESLAELPPLVERWNATR